MGNKLKQLPVGGAITTYRVTCSGGGSDEAWAIWGQLDNVQ